MAVQQGGGRAIFHAELTVQTAAGHWPGMAAPTSADGHALDVAGVEAILLTQFQRGFDGILHVDLGWETLDVEAWVDQSPRGAEVAGGNVPVELSAEYGGCIAYGRFQYLVAGGVAHPGEDGRFSAHASGIAGVGGLDHGSRVGGQPAGAGGGDAQRHQRLVRVQAQGLG